MVALIGEGSAAVGAFGGGAGEGQVGGLDVVCVFFEGIAGEGLGVGGYGVGVSAGDGAGEGAIAVGEGVVEGGSEERFDVAGRVLDADGGQDLEGLAGDGDQVVGSVGEGCVVEGRSPSAMRTGSPPISTTRAWAMG